MPAVLRADHDTRGALPMIHLCTTLNPDEPPSHTATLPAPDSDIRMLLRALRFAGWRHTLDWQRAGLDPDGAPEHEGWRVHRWTRGTEAIEVWRDIDDGQLVDAITYVADHGDDRTWGNSLSVGLEWVRAHGFRSLRALARAANVITVITDPEGTRP
jgi:hypothetical protein